MDNGETYEIFTTRSLGRQAGYWDAVCILLSNFEGWGWF